MFSALAASNEDQYYNTSTGSSEMTPQGYPAAFFPRKLNRNPTFVVVFPVRLASPDVIEMPVESPFVSKIPEAWY